MNRTELNCRSEYYTGWWFSSFLSPRFYSADGNALTGSIPAEIQRLTSMTAFFLSKFLPCQYPLFQLVYLHNIISLTFHPQKPSQITIIWLVPYLRGLECSQIWSSYPLVSHRNIATSLAGTKQSYHLVSHRLFLAQTEIPWRGPYLLHSAVSQAWRSYIWTRINCQAKSLLNWANYRTFCQIGAKYQVRTICYWIGLDWTDSFVGVCWKETHAFGTPCHWPPEGNLFDDTSSLPGVCT